MPFVFKPPPVIPPFRNRFLAPAQEKSVLTMRSMPIFTKALDVDDNTVWVITPNV
jgi:hypothetical protein